MTTLRALLVAILLLPTVAFGQSAVSQAGPPAAGHAPMYLNSTGGHVFAQDSGPARGGKAGVGLSELLLAARGTGTPPYSGQGTGPYGTNFCDYDAPITNPTGYHFLCWSPNVGGNALIAMGASGSAPPGVLNFNINGSTYQFPYTIGGIVGPSTTTISDLACWNNTSGTLLKDCTLNSVLSGVPTKIFNVQDPAYGALGNGVHDDTAAIQAAENAAAANGSGTIYFPQTNNYYVITSSINCGQNGVVLAFVGDSARTHIHNNAVTSIPTFNCNNSVFQVQALTFKNLTLTTNLHAAGNMAFNIVNQQEVFWENNFIYGYNKGIVLTTSYAPIVGMNNYFNVIDGAAISAISPTTDASFNGAVIHGVTFAGVGLTSSVCAVPIVNAVGVSMAGNDFSTNYCHVSFDGVTGASLTGNYMEAATTGNFVFGNANGGNAGISVTGNALQVDAGTTVQYVAGFNLADNQLYGNAWTFTSTATQVRTAGNSLQGGATLGLPTFTFGTPLVASSSMQTSSLLTTPVTIASLPSCSAALLGTSAAVSNGTAYGTGTYGSAVSATGAVTRRVACTNTAGPTTYAWAYN